jgi:hypothetical protein
LGGDVGEPEDVVTHRRDHDSHEGEARDEGAPKPETSPSKEREEKRGEKGREEPGLAAQSQTSFRT